MMPRWDEDKDPSVVNLTKRIAAEWLRDLERWGPIYPADADRVMKFLYDTLSSFENHRSDQIAYLEKLLSNKISVTPGSFTLPPKETL